MYVFSMIRLSCLSAKRETPSCFPVRECRYRQGRTGRMDKMGPALPHQGVCRAPTENTPPLRCHTGNNGASSVQRRTGGDQSENQTSRLHGLRIS